jgi:hypothetical protein
MNQELLKLSSVCLKVAGEISRGKIRMKELRRSRVFFDNGACGCAFGHVLTRAGLKGRMAPFHIRGEGGGRSARWISNTDAFTAATGILLNDGGVVHTALEELELANDVPSGNERKTALVKALTDLSQVVMSAAS